MGHCRLLVGGLQPLVASAVARQSMSCSTIELLSSMNWSPPPYIDMAEGSNHEGPSHHPLAPRLGPHRVDHVHIPVHFGLRERSELVGCHPLVERQILKSVVPVFSKSHLREMTLYLDRKR